MRPIWEYRKTPRATQTQRTTPLKQEDGTYAQNANQAIQAWANWIKQEFQIPPQEETPENEHITEKQWEQMNNANNENATQNTQHKQTTRNAAPRKQLDIPPRPTGNTRKLTT